MGEPTTPEHDKAKKFESEMQDIGEFITWLTGEKKLWICELVHEDYYPVPMTDLKINQLLAEFYGIDFKAYQAEKEAVYQYVSALANKT